MEAAMIVLAEIMAFISRELVINRYSEINKMTQTKSNTTRWSFKGWSISKFVKSRKGLFVTAKSPYCDKIIPD